MSDYFSLRVDVAVIYKNIIITTCYWSYEFVGFYCYVT